MGKNYRAPVPELSKIDCAQGTACSRPCLTKAPNLGTHPIRTLRLNRRCAIAASSLSVRSLAGLLPLTFAQTDAWAAAVLVDEFDACFLERLPRICMSGCLPTAEPAFRELPIAFWSEENIGSCR